MLEQYPFESQIDMKRLFKYLNGDDENYTSTKDYFIIQEYFYSTGDMPYGTMKARTSDPEEWIYDRLEDAYITYATI